ncbi:MAG TPA: hypothetical protein VGI60_03340 [Chthoniobacterales bacterium]
MRKNPRESGTNQSVADEISGLERALDRAYTRLRERACGDWERYQGSKSDPANAVVTVRVAATDTPPPPTSSKRKPHLLVSKSRSKIPPTKRHRPHK